MIITKIMHGLGNQLFQYAIGRVVSVKLKATLKFDISHFQQNVSRSFELKCFKHPRTIETNNDQNTNDLFWFYEEPHFHFDKNFKKIQHNTFLSGFWQSEKYFKQYRQLLLEDLTVEEEYVKDVQYKVAEIKNHNSISIHIRRGDYTKAPFINIFGTLPLEYYLAAIQTLKKKVRDFKIYFFSDDIEWVRANFVIDVPHEFVSGTTQNHIEDFFLMMNCNHHIIANSSFSWWSAWLSQNREKIVIAPKQWFANTPWNTKDVIPSDWTKL